MKRRVTQHWIRELLVMLLVKLGMGDLAAAFWDFGQLIE
jgi:hypothetical protein